MEEKVFGNPIDVNIMDFKYNMEKTITEISTFDCNNKGFS